MRTRLSLALAFIALAAGPARAVSLDPDEDAARRHFARGGALYDEGRYREAIAEFGQARALAPRPALDFNIGRCHERLEEWREAADAFERYLRATPDASDTATVRARVAKLRARAAMPAPVVALEASPGPVEHPGVASRRGLRPAAIATGALAVVSAAIGLGLVLSVGSDIEARTPECTMRQCGPGDIADLNARLDAGYALFALAAGAAIADVVLWTVDARGRRPAVAAAPTGLAVRF